MTQDLKIPNQDQTIHARGRLIGEGTSYQPGRARWMEVRLYELERPGTYIVHKTGMSTLQHRPGCSDWELPVGSYDETRLDCVRCRPMPGTTVEYEVPYHHATMCSNPNAAVTSLHSNKSGVMRLTRPAEDALFAADDPALMEAYHNFRPNILSA